MLVGNQHEKKAFGNEFYIRLGRVPTPSRPTRLNPRKSSAVEFCPRQSLDCCSLPIEPTNSATPVEFLGGRRSLVFVTAFQHDEMVWDRLNRCSLKVVSPVRLNQWPLSSWSCCIGLLRGHTHFCFASKWFRTTYPFTAGTEDRRGWP